VVCRGMTPPGTPPTVSGTDTDLRRGLRNDAC